MCVCVCVCVQSPSHFQLFATLWIIAHQASLFMGFFRQKYQSELTFPTPGIFPTQGSNPDLLRRQADSWSLRRLGNPAVGVSLYQSISSATGAHLKLQREQDIFYLTLWFFSLLVLSGLWDKREPASCLPFMPVLEGNFPLSSDTFTGALKLQLPPWWVGLHLENWQAGKTVSKTKIKTKTPGCQPGAW